jgi:nucleoside 2-deoxyribosyltransferase
MTAGPYRIFLSHSAHDKGLVEGVASQLQAVGVEVYLYEEHSQPGRSIPEKLQEAIRNCDALVALLTPASGHRPFVHEEIGFALGAGKQAVALLTTDVTDQEVLGMLQGEYIRLDPSDPWDGMSKLLTFLHGQQVALRRQADAAAQASQRELAQAIVLIAGLLLIAYALSKSSGGAA